LAYIQNGTQEYKKASFALFLGGFVTFSILYTTQPLMPEFSREFHVSAPIASLSLSLSTGVLAVTMLLAACISDVIGKKQIMTLSMLFTSILGLLTAFTPNFGTLLVFRALLGVFIAGIPSIAMGYIAEEFNPQGIGKIMGLYISGTSIGGMAGRIITGVITDFFSWRFALITIGVLALILSILFWCTIPSPRRVNKKKMDWQTVWEGYKTHLLNKKPNRI
jgi:YNFM family putative membrane transporter